MAPAYELPPPPERPELPPEVKIAGEEELMLEAADGVSIEARARLSPDATRAVVICHPHPLYGGAMHNAVVVVLAKAFAELGPRVGALRLNYRGVGKSGGRYDAGKDEVLDARAALDEVRRRCPEARLSVAGYSFGTGVAYGAALADDGVERLSLIAPSPRVLKNRVGEWRGPTQIVAAGRDQYCGPEETRDLTERLRAELSIVPEADHYFVRFRREVARLVVPFLAPDATP